MGIEHSQYHEVEEQLWPNDAEDQDIRFVIVHAKDQTKFFDCLNAPVKERIDPLIFTI